jgi:hypothetical protein
MQTIEGIVRERVRFAKSKLAGGDAPAPAQLAAFLRALVESLRPHTAAIPAEAKQMLQEAFKMASWDVMSNGPLAGCSRPCSVGELVAFLETMAKRLRIGVVTAGWGEYRPAPAGPASSGGGATFLATSVDTTAVTSEPEPEPSAEDVAAAAARSAARAKAKAAKAARASLEAEAAALMKETAVLSLVEKLETNPDGATMAEIDADPSLQHKLAVLVRVGVLQPPDVSGADGGGKQEPALAPRMAEVFTGEGELARAVTASNAAAAEAVGMGSGDTPMLQMAEDEAIRSLEVEIEAQLERNHYRALGI